MKVGDPVTVLPEGLQSRVRGLQVHGKKQDAAYAGSRVAVNLAGVEVRELERGSVLVPPGYLRATTLLDGSVSVLATSPRPLAHRTRIRLHIGTAEVIGRAAVLGANQIAPGTSGLVQLVLERPVVAARGDRFVLRFYSPMNLLGGGVVLDPVARRHKRNDADTVDRLRRALKGDPEDISFDAIAASDTGLLKKDTARLAGLAEADFAAAAKGLIDGGRVIEYQGRLIARTAYEGVAARVKSELAAYHAASPMRPGMPKEELRARFGSHMDQKGFQAVLALMASEGEIALSEANVRLPEHKVTLNQRQQQVAAAIEEDYRRAGVNPPLMAEVEQKHGGQARAITALLVERGDLVKITPELLFHPETLEQTEAALRDYLGKNDQMTVAQFRDLIGSSRKFVVPLLEYFDSKRVTRRVGDMRALFK
jgi:selenocysteine-specific elongation factor